MHARAHVRGRLVAALPNIDIKRRIIALTPKTASIVIKILFVILNFSSRVLMA